MKQNTQLKSPEPVVGEVITLSTMKVRKRKMPWSMWLSTWLRRAVPALLGIALLVVCWQLAAINSKGFPTPLSTLDSALTLFADPFYNGGPNDMGIGWNVLASLQRVAIGFGLAALVGIPLGFLIGRFTFFSHMFSPLIALLRPVSPLAWLRLDCCCFKKRNPHRVGPSLSALYGDGDQHRRRGAENP